MSNYGINDIETLSFRDGVRQRIAMYLGSADMQGVYNAIQEIISNSIDEFYMGYGDKIEIGLCDSPQGQVITITDHGRGIPFGIKEDGTNVLVDIFSKPHTGGKFNDKVYNSVAGLNGIGAKATCLSSLKFAVSVVRDGKRAMANWEKGELIDYKEMDAKNCAYGTSIQFILDPEVYNLEPINIDYNVLCNKCKNLSYLTKGLTFDLKNYDKNGAETHNVYCAKNGILDLVEDNVTSPIHSTPLYFELEDENEKVEVALQWTKGKEKSFVFTNGLHNSEGGTPLTGMKTAITTFMKKQFRGEFDGDMARTGLIFAVSCKTPNPSFANQTKTKINNPSLRGLAQRATGAALSAFQEQYPDEFKSIIDFLSKERKAEQAANRAREAVLTQNKEIAAAAKKKVLMADKLKDAEFLGEEATLLIVEGDSAAGAIIQGRDVDHYGLLPIRGKCINALSNPMEDVLANEEVKAILMAMGITANGTFNPKKLRYGKLGICVDADDDGAHIALLVTALIYALCPEFVLDGRLCWLKAPLYKVVSGGKVNYYFNDSELPKDVKGEITRYKGLGEMKPEDVESAMFGKYQRLEQIDPSPMGLHTLEQIMGKDVQPRKDFVFNNIDFSTIEV
jgi:DNA gyrase subunit B